MAKFNAYAPPTSGDDDQDGLDYDIEQGAKDALAKLNNRTRIFGAKGDSLDAKFIRRMGGNRLEYELEAERGIDNRAE